MSSEAYRFESMDEARAYMEFCSEKRAAKIKPDSEQDALELTAFKTLRGNLPLAGNFYQTGAWRAVRYESLLRSGGHCECCKNRARPDAPLHVDHIKPRSKYPQLELDKNNLQALCADCNLGKSNTDETDWREI